MHELPITQNILQIALRHAGDARRILQINLVIGDLSAVIGESVQFYWDIISKETIAKGATLHFERIRACFQCKDCGHEYQPDGRKFECPQCGSDQVNLVAGQEFRLESIEVE
ncbi:MAG TPA: hydrogenase maturation nickel metallochaperone HypA [Anaerolineae bacterium]|nr:hydrogenase maturation nickel metallochaperone HypA [Anaerolineae bacterium]